MHEKIITIVTMGGKNLALLDCEYTGLCYFLLHTERH